MLQSTNDILVIKGFAVTEMLRTLALILIAFFFHIPPKEGRISPLSFALSMALNTSE